MENQPTTYLSLGAIEPFDDFLKVLYELEDARIIGSQKVKMLQEGIVEEEDILEDFELEDLLEAQHKAQQHFKKIIQELKGEDLNRTKLELVVNKGITKKKGKK